MSKKEKSALIWLDRTLFLSPYCYALCTSEKKFRDELKRLGMPKKLWGEFVLSAHSDATTHFITNTAKNVKPCAIVCIRNFENAERSAVYGLLIHEAVHIWQEVKINCGEHSPGAEFEAYAVQAIAQQLIEAFDDEHPAKPEKREDK